MTRYSILPICLALAACATRPIPDVSHAQVWHAENGYARATTGAVPVYSPNQANHAVVPQNQPTQYVAPQQTNPYVVQQNPYVQPQQQNPYVTPQQTNPYVVQQNPYAPPQQQNPYVAPQQTNPYVVQQNPYVPPQQTNPYVPPQQTQYVAPQPAPQTQVATTPPKQTTTKSSTKKNSTAYPVIIDNKLLYPGTQPVQPNSSLTSKQSVASVFNNNGQNDFSSLIMQAENQSSGLVRNVLAQSRAMTYRKEIIKGGCWDYLDAAWSRAGVSRDMRQTVYKSESSGAYANVNDLRAGDWIYHINHSYKNIEHSGMFIGWVDKSRNLGLTLSYAGEGRKEPARYKVYDLSSVYNIMRAPS